MLANIYYAINDQSSTTNMPVENRIRHKRKYNYYDGVSDSGKKRKVSISQE